MIPIKESPGYIIAKEKGWKSLIKGGPGSGIRGHVTNRPQQSNAMQKLTPGTELPDYIKKLKIPSAWTNVTYNSNPDGALLVKGFDSKNRSVKIYSEKFKQQNADKKFSRINELMKKSERIAKENEANLKHNKTKESAAVMQLIMNTGIRPGSDKDTGAKVKAYGATTLEGRHVKIDNGEVRLDFVGKKGVNLSIPVTDKAIAISLLQRSKISGPNGKLFNVNEKQLINYSHSLDGGSFKTKDFRTLLGTKTAMEKVNEIKSPPKTLKEYKQMVKDIAITVAKKLGNTPTIALQSYINPTVFSKLQGAF